MVQLQLAVAVDLRSDRVRAVFELLADVRELPGLADLGVVVVGVLRERERHDPLRDEVAAVDPGERLRDHGLDSQVERGERGVLSRGALAVVVARDDDPAPPLLEALAELGVAVAQGELGDRGDVRAVRHHLDPVGREVASRDVVGLHGRDTGLKGLL